MRTDFTNTKSHELLKIRKRVVSKWMLRNTLLCISIPVLLCSLANAQTTITIGAGTTFNTTTTYPAPYGNWYWGARHQILVRASELIAAGASAGNITSLAFNVATLNGTPLNNFAIKIKTTAATSLSTFDVTTFTNVWGPQSYTETNGWNTHTFSSPLYWDGTSNLLIETCFNNSNFTNNAQTYYTTTSYNSVVYINQDASGVCTSTATTSVAVNRPNMRFGMQQLNAPPVVKFGASPTYSCNGAVNFSDSSTNIPTSWFWNFGDGDTSTLKNPSHTYLANGAFTVKLKACNVYGCDSLTKTNFITVDSTGVSVAASCSPSTIAYCCGYGIINFSFNTLSNASADASEGYKNFTCMGATVKEGKIYGLTITTGINEPEDLKVWIDYNNDGSFSTTTEQVFSSTNSFTHTGNVNIPGGAVLNTPLRMRVLSDEVGAAITPCFNPLRGQAEDYAVIILPNTDPPLSGFSANATSTCTGVISFTDTSSGAVTSWFWNFGDGQTDTVKNPTHTYSATGSYTIKLKVCNAFGCDSLSKTNYITVVSTTGSPVSASCTPATTANCCGIGIYNVTFNTINNTTAGGSDGYKDYVCTSSTMVYAGSSYTLSIQTGTSWAENVSVWIDYNNDGSFATSEQVFSSNSVLTYHSGTVAIASNAVVNTPLRMRVISDYNTIVSACNNVMYGQTEDYSISVSPNTVPPVAKFGADKIVSCNGAIAFSDSSLNSPASWLWNFGDGTTDTIQNPTHNYADTGKYSVTLKVCNSYGCDSLSKTNYIYVVSLACINAVIGNGTTSNGSTTYPAPYGNAYFGAKHQILLLASELLATGAAAGYITGLSFNVNIPSVANLTGFTIMLKPTTATALTTAMQTTGFTTVYGPNTYKNIVGWNTHNFSTPFYWDGTSNLLVQTCFNNNTATGNSQMYRTTTSFTSVSFARSNTTTVCGSTTAFGTSTQRPNIKLTMQAPTVPPITKFSASPTTTCNGQVSFLDSSLYASNWLWSFGDGTTSTQQYPSHTYSTTGTYSVKLKVCNAYGCDSLTKASYINVTSTNCVTATIGTGSTYNSTTGYPAPYGNSWYGAKHQMLIRASELTAAGATDGNITSLAFNIFSSVGVPLNSFTIKLKATSAAAVSATFDGSGFTTVFGPQAYTESNGWNIHTFSSPFYWDGISNVLVETCFNNATFSSNAQHYYTATGFLSAVYYRTNTTTVCSNTTGTTSGNRPNMRFTVQPVQLPPMVKFGALSSFTCTGTIYFYDSSLYSPTSWLWEFGDGTISTLKNPVHNYSAPGTYTVKLKSCNAYGCDSLTKTSYIIYSQNPQPVPPSCTPVTTSYCCGFGIYNVTFVNISNSTNDGADSYQSYTCQYQTTVVSGQSYPVTVKTGVTNGENVRIWIDYNNDGVLSNTTEQVFASNSIVQNHSGNITISTSAVTNTPLRMRVGSDASFNTPPTPCANVNYGQFEDYTVKILPNNIAPIADFTITVLDSCQGIVKFTDLSVPNPTSWLWDFGDGTGVSSLQSPYYTYNSSGTFTVVLNATNGFGTGAVTKPITISKLVANFTISDTAIVGTVVNFTDNTSGATTWTWDFGDGYSASVQNPAHAYPATGVYTVKLTVKNSSGCIAQKTKQIVIVPVGIAEYSNYTTLLISPNPASGDVLLQYIFTGRRNLAITIKNALGQIVYAEKIEKAVRYERRLELSDFNAGVYFIQVNDGKTQRTDKLVVR